MAKTQEKDMNTIDNNIKEVNEAEMLKDILNQLKSMQNQINTLEKEKNELENKNSELLAEVNRQNQKRSAIRDRDSQVTLYFNGHGVLHAILPDLDLCMERFGEERQITFSQFQQLIGKYRKFFDRERLLVGPEDIDLVDKFKVKAYDPNSEQYIHYNDIEKLSNMSGRELEQYYDKLSDKSKNGLLTLWMSKCYKREPGFYSVEKMDALNRASSSKTFNLLIDEIRRTEERNSNK